MSNGAAQGLSDLSLVADLQLESLLHGISEMDLTPFLKEFPFPEEEPVKFIWKNATLPFLMVSYSTLGLGSIADLYFYQSFVDEYISRNKESCDLEYYGPDSAMPVISREGLTFVSLNKNIKELADEIRSIVPNPPTLEEIRSSMDNLNTLQNILPTTFWNSNNK